MTKTIEFVERKIKDKKDQLKRLENLKTISNKYELKINESLMKNAEEDIEHLEQIKCELEAWELMADRIFYGVGRCLIDSSVWFGEEAETIKKALEVKNE